MSDELHYWHETDDPHRIEATPPPDGGRLIYHDHTLIDGDRRIQMLELMKHSRIEPDLIKLPDGDTRIVGISFVPFRGDIHEAYQGSFQAEVARMREELGDNLLSAINRNMLMGEPRSSLDTPPREWNPSPLTRFKLWVRRQINQVREWFASGEQEEWDDE